MIYFTTDKHGKQHKCKIKIKLLSPTDPNAFHLNIVPPRRFVVDDKGAIRYVK